MKVRLLRWILPLFFLLEAPVYGQLELPEDKVSWEFSVQQNGCEATVVAKITVVEHWHINSVKLPPGSFGFPTSLKLTKSSDFTTKGGVIEPKPKLVYDELADEQLSYHEGTVLLKRKINVNSEKDFEISGTFVFQTCNDVKCLPDYSVDFTVKVKGCKPEVSEDSGKPELKMDGDFVTDQDGNAYVYHNLEWVKVPEGNSAKFYKHYLELGGKYEDQ